MAEITDAILQEMIKGAQAAQDNAYSPYSKHPVGAAILAEDGKIYTGCNVETANYKGFCAEGSAIASMVSAGQRHIMAVVVTSPGEHLCTPCGDCRQRIREFHTAETKIYAATRAGHVEKTFLLKDLLPHSFGPENLDLS